MAATALRWQPLLPPNTNLQRRHRQMVTFKVEAFRRSDMDNFAKRMTSGEAWKDAWRTANDGMERFIFEARKTAERLDRQYALSNRLSSVARSAADRAREIDREFEISPRWRTFTMDFRRNWPQYRVQLNKFLDSPLGKGFVTTFFIWFALSGWLFRILIIATWVLPFAGPLLIGALANNLAIQGNCPACKMQFVGLKSQVIRCTSCGNIVWQPTGGFSSRDGKRTSASKSDPEIIDVDFEEK
ncbi:hypothetical protein PIB30_007223 [Stylosanthes scabra]|uniref:Uncharacterized protein n=1 Tax=Stylosanthes scabra TaxID=79078 RepID=A0ABU6V6C9_9FABA|nr:hypothetical protein [Stylosanthes scabra]